MSVHLTRAGRLEAHQEECVHLSRREWSGRGSTDADFLRVKGSNVLDDEGLRVLRAVWTYRDDQARQMDRPAFKVLPGQVLLDLAKRRPATEAALAQVMRSGSSMARRHGDALLAAVQAGLADDAPLPARPRASGGRQKRLARSSSDAPGVDKLYTVLKDWRNRVVEDEGLPPVVVANNTLLKDIARVAPTTPEQLAAVPDMRSWQVEEFGDRILSLIQGVSSDEPAKPKRKRRRRRRRGNAESGAEA
jgi:ribonuclease D